ncbi:hypothetical protein B0H15DRAFT_958726 [Mycena belliarum]|uniref:Uncharacterized protein n=1 Tax=Mycena belliarum TaxID=1033014 RepID=A0AAD6TK28_9AGAR|nr:hypothetical protein B0H15DRAFT_958726 [Mycena belliae]
MDGQTRRQVTLGTSVNKAPWIRFLRSRASGDSVKMSASGSDAGEDSSGESPPPRNILDFPLDDGAAEWEDEDRQLQGLGTTTHHSRNRDKEIIPIRKYKKRPTDGVNGRATARKRREALQATSNQTSLG